MPSKGFRRVVSRSRRRKRATRAGRASSPLPRRIRDGAMNPASGVREELVARVRSEIRAGTYDTDEKFEIALSRMLSGLSRD